MRIEDVVLGNLVLNEDYSRKVLPFLKPEFFHEESDRVLFTLVNDYIHQYNSFPSREALVVESSLMEGLSDKRIKEIEETISNLEAGTKDELGWLLDTTEQFCQDKALYNALMEAIKIVDDKNNKSLSRGSIPKILSDALAVSFDTSIGHDYNADYELRYDLYHKVVSKIPFDLEYMNLITDGGLPKKTLNIALAGTGVGKSLFMCHCAAANIMTGHNVLYITMEMAEEKIAERIDANLMDRDIADLKVIPKETYMKTLERITTKAKGKLIIKEYPTAGAGAANFRHLINELRLKKNFVPDIVYIDYLNICISSRIKPGSNINSYTYIKAIAEELRGLAVEFNVPIVSATQTTRSGYSSSDVGLEDTSESFGLPATADFMFALISNEQLQELNQMMVKQLKNRYGDVARHRRFVIGVDKSKMKLYDVEQSAQEDIVDDGPAFDNSRFGERESGFKGKFDSFR